MVSWRLSQEERERLLRAARKALTQAYAPYSHIRVGAAALTAQGEIYPGVNVENASYGLTVCAERAAIFNAVAREGPGMRLMALAVASDREGAFPPCGACRQVMAEFGPDAVIIFQGPAGFKEMPLAGLLPESFTLD